REIGNLLFALSPLWILGVAVVPRSGRRFLVTPAGRVLTALAVPFALSLLFVHPRQGIFRDWDVFSPAAQAVSMLTAALAGAALAAMPRCAGVALAMLLAALVPTIQWLELNHDADPGLKAVRAWLAEPPVHPTSELTLTWSYLGTRLAELDSLDAAAAAHGRAAALTPNP